MDNASTDGARSILPVLRNTPVILQLIFLPLTAFFIIGILLTTDVRQAIAGAGNEVPELV